MTGLFTRARCWVVGIVGALTLMAGGPAMAWDGVVSGTISAIDITFGTNYAFRIYLNGVTTVCTGGQPWGYLNEPDSNYKTFVANLMMAKAQGSLVTLFSNLEGGYCHIAYIRIT